MARCHRQRAKRGLPGYKHDPDFTKLVESTKTFPQTVGLDGYGLGPLDSADAVFRGLTTGSKPLALNPARAAVIRRLADQLAHDRFLPADLACANLSWQVQERSL